MLPDREIARREEGRILVRPAPLRVRWELDRLVTADGHEMRGTFQCSVRALDEASERQMLEEVFLATESAVTIDRVVAHFAPTLHASASRIAETRPVESLLDPATQRELLDALRQAAGKIAFACGIEILPPLELDLESPSVQKQKLDAMHRQLAEQRSAGQIEQFKRAADLLKQFETIRSTAPGLSASRVLQQLSPDDRTAALQSLLMASAESKSAAKDLLAVSGNAFVRIDGQTQTLAMIDLPATLGPFRSVQSARLDDRDVTLIGARSGVLLIDGGQPPRAFSAGDVSSVLGFNRAVAWNGQIWACHSELGVFAWGDERSEASNIPVREARHLTILDAQRLLVSSGADLIVVPRDTAPQTVGTSTSSDIVEIIVDDGGPIVVYQNGLIVQRDRQTLEIVAEHRHPLMVTAAGALPWLGSSRLLLAGESGPVLCVGLDDSLTTHYASAHTGLRKLIATPSLIAGVSSDRQRLVLWHPWDGRHPASEIYLTRLTKHRVADIAVAHA